ncbi:hypothetical protein ACFVIM_13660 [Streptomyces sp. NPDC057638]|uniref:hypothetical protein n=1 Tax=Streptomyces sp. NPDC057638 TaxID=3346190 RepID=UPI0036838776
MCISEKLHALALEAYERMIGLVLDELPLNGRILGRLADIERAARQITASSNRVLPAPVRTEPYREWCAHACPRIFHCSTLRWDRRSSTIAVVLASLPHVLTAR